VHPDSKWSECSGMELLEWTSPERLIKVMLDHLNRHNRRPVIASWKRREDKLNAVLALLRKN